MAQLIIILLAIQGASSLSLLAHACKRQVLKYVQCMIGTMSCISTRIIDNKLKSRLAIRVFNFLVHHINAKRLNDIMRYETVVILKWVLCKRFAAVC